MSDTSAPQGVSPTNQPQRPNASETARTAIEIERTLSPAMRRALQEAPSTGLVTAAPSTMRALRRRELVGSTEATYRTMTDLGGVVRAVAIRGADAVLAAAARKDREAEPRQGHHNRTDENGVVHRVDVHRRALCDIELEPLTMGRGNVMCFACIDAMFPNERDRARYLGQRPDIARAAGLKGLDATYERTAAFAESMSVEYLIRNIENRRRWAVRDAYAAEELRAYMDALHALALVDNAERTIVEVAQQLGTRYHVRRVNDSDFFAVVDADHQNRTVSGMTRDLDEAKAWQREAHRQWAERVVNERASTPALRDNAEPAQQRQAADRRPQVDEAQGTYRELTFEDFPDNGHMLVISAEWDAVYWLADRHAVIREGAVELDGPGQRLLEARADERGMITFKNVREHDVTRVADGTPAARAVAQLTDPKRIEETLYPPYIADVKARPARPYLQPPQGLIYRDAVVLDRERSVVYWLLTDYDRLEDSGVFEAPLGGYGPVYWGMTHESTRYPEGVLPALINDAHSE